ncbi:nuclear transport factor 2 family protein [Amycolatopsis sp. H20-H5]|uniref:nuclear transport factor 2 family protein n=1 Tax=Amycolatopsis sp. H20-H5 TaxID=3046309 RepID=UPI002DBEC00A|nr:nuclear transport factor 2 family protein [Amycolatopsis sp. H20-H5]MEC3973793.1 nuclear transport factor 2 family protein [Amycolatopsis sp. H20-H5]
MTTPTEVFARLSEGFSSGNWDELSALYAEDTVVEQPQHPPVPIRVEGRETVHAHFTGPLAASVRMRPHHVVVHETADPEVIVAEYRYSGESLVTGKTFESANIVVQRIRDGLIVTSRDYHDFLRLLAAQDTLPAMVKAAEAANASLVLPPIPPRPVSMAAPGSPRGVFERLVYGVSDGKWDELAELYAEETHVTHPFVPGAPTLTTRDDLRGHFAAGATTGLKVEARDLVLHEGKDPEMLFAEFDYQGTTADGRPFRASNIFAMRIRDGLIVESRDYGDVFAIGAATGRLGELAERL